jgi:hypothetical protein
MTRTLSTHAKAAKEIRRKLKATYPTCTFSVKSRSFSGGDAVDIVWTDGPTTYKVEEIVNLHQMGHFDGMQDLYEYTNRHPNIPQVKYAHTRRELSPESRQALEDAIREHFGDSLQQWEVWQYVHRYAGGRSCVCTCGHHGHILDLYCEECGIKVNESLTEAARYAY